MIKAILTTCFITLPSFIIFACASTIPKSESSFLNTAQVNELCRKIREGVYDLHLTTMTKRSYALTPKELEEKEERYERQHQQDRNRKKRLRHEFEKSQDAMARSIGKDPYSWNFLERIKQRAKWEEEDRQQEIEWRRERVERIGRY
ncbi:hypothetical protein AGMMS49531_07550 [Endomicrobiia bacterium]|nr:hypothetical protein AGMMS49531_07550 [Endomicrobiia bacterium]